MRTNRIICALVALLTAGAPVIMGGPVPAWGKNRKQSDGNVRIYVEYRLAKDGLLKDNNIRVGVANGKITLTGTVPTLHARADAAAEARKVERSFAVVDDLTVPAPFVSDSVLAADVLHRVEDHTFYTVFDWLTVGVNKGVVTLHGWVNDPWEVREYASEASKVPGVTRIINKLKPETNFGYLRYRVARLIYGDPLFWQYDTELNPPVHVVVNDGTVILEGYVDSSGEKGFLATEVIFRTDAVRVVNNLQVVSD